jgi:tetratricopeptide (TPR) repeat protein
MKIMPRSYWAQLSVFSLALGSGAKALTAPAPAKADEAVKWSGEIPKDYASAESWIELTQVLSAHELYYGAVAVAEQLNVFFKDTSAKENAFNSWIAAMDRGGYPFAIEDYFKTAFLDPDPKSTLGQNYFFYKGKLAEKQKRDKWSKYYFSFLNKDAFPKFMFFQALKLYEAGKLDEALPILTKILKENIQPDMPLFYARVARTKARIHFELKQYDKSFEIYEKFLLRMSPLEASDWVEAAWNLYALEQYERALGFLYNLETSSKMTFLNLEKYIVRAAIYKNLCARTEMTVLSENFERDFGPALDKVRLGTELKAIDVLLKIKLKSIDEFQKYFFGLNQLRREKLELSRIPSRLRPQAERVYLSQEAYLRRMAHVRMLPYLDRAAERLVILGESLKFLKFDVDRSVFNPDTVFLPEIAESGSKESLLKSNGGKAFEIHWPQRGDVWRDEKLNYNVRIANQCAK